MEVGTASWVHWYNETRLHSACDDVPAEFEASHYRHKEADEVAQTQPPESLPNPGRFMGGVARM